MTFNPLMLRLARALTDLVDEKPSVVELGNQTLNASAEAFASVLERSSGNASIDVAGIRELAAKPGEGRVGDLYRMLGFSKYRAIDVNDLYGSLIMDLNLVLRDAYDFDETFSLVTNNGTGEHVFNQDSIFRNAHNLCAPGGVMLHVMPFIEYVNHGFYSFHPNLYHAVAVANGYRLIAQGISTRDGDGAIARNPRSEDVMPHFLRDEREISLGTLLSGAKPPTRGAAGWLRDRARRLVKPTTDGQRFHDMIRSLQHKRPKILHFAVFRKLEDTPFRTPIQTRYADDIGDDSLKAKYVDTSSS